MSTTTTTGTSLEILAPYLPYGIEVEVCYQDAPDKDRGLLAGLDAETGAIKVLMDEPRYRGPRVTTPGKLPIFIKASDCVPLLRPFSALTEPLPDGSIPAVEVAKMMGREGNISYRIEDDALELYQDSGESDTPFFCYDIFASLSLDGSLYDYDARPTPAVEIINYLRRNLFALPVNGRPLVEGIDFIAK